MSDGLLPYILGDSLVREARSFGEAVMLSSPDQISYAKRAFGSDTSAFVRRLVAELEAHPGELVPLFDPAQEATVPAVPTPIRGPRRAGVMVDGGTVSASEVLVLKALRTERAVVIGEPTAGALDYQSTSVVRIHPDESQWLLGYPTITAHAELPKGGMRGKGIQPEAPLNWATVGDPYAAALEVVRRR
jgi:C-terminal processing protease CtpA/Prc